MKRSDKPLRYEKHALKRMQERGVSRDQVKRTVHRPLANRPARRDGARRLEQKMSARKRLAVIVEEDKGFFRVVSAFWL